MQLLSKGPNVIMIYHYMRSKGYTPNYAPTAGKKVITFTKTLHNAEFPKSTSLKGLVIVHKIDIDIVTGAVSKHWLENRGLAITCWEYIHLLDECFDASIKFYNSTKEWMKKGWILEAAKELTATKKKPQTKKKNTF